MVFILWDASDIWGPLAVWGVNGLGVPCRVVRASDVAEGLLERECPSTLLVPGGFSRRKAVALGKKGMEAVRSYVACGGAYIGFCGGAGLALTGECGLGICPWRRAGYASRIQHYMSGHFHVRAGTDGRLCRRIPPSPLLPVWWPGRFAPEPDAGVTVLASYDAPGPDFWLADLPAANLPPGVFQDWEEKYGFSPSPSFLRGEPCVIHGEYGKGEYLLAYTHLETPGSPDANRWFAHLLREMGEEKPKRDAVPAWNLDTARVAWHDPGLKDVRDALFGVLNAGVAAGLFFARSSWLLGWRTGLPGAVLNTVRAELHAILSLPPAPAAEAFRAGNATDFVPAFRAFAERATSHLLAERLAMTLSKELPDALAPSRLLKERAAIFGASGMAAHAGGMLGELLPVLNELALLQLQGNTPCAKENG